MNKSSKKAVLLAVALVCPAGIRAASVILDWDAVTTNADATPITDLAGYRVFHRTSLLPGTTAAAMADASVTKTQLGNVVTLTLNNLTDGTSYYFRVTARDNSGNQSAFSLDAFDQDVDVSTFTPAPAVPTGVGATASSYQQVNVSWTDNSTGETGFRIERSLDGVTYNLLTTTAAAAGTGSRTYQDATVAPSTTYFYRVRANGTSLNSGFGTSGPVTTPAAPTNPPVQPTNLRVTSAGNTQVSLAWNDNSTDETAFELRWSLNGATGWTAILPAQGPGVQAYTHTGLAAGTSYYYQVRAVNGIGNPAFAPATPIVGRTTGGASPGGFTPPPGLKEAYAYPNPAVGADPKIRAFMGGVDSIEVTIFDQAGKVAHTGRSTTQGTAGGETFFEYVWTGEKTSGVYYAVIHGRKGDQTIRARAKFAVVR